MAYHHRHPDDKMFDKLSRNKDLEEGLQQIQANPSQDPVVRQMAETILRECEKAEKRRHNRAIAFCFGLVIGIIMVAWKLSLSHK